VTAATIFCWLYIRKLQTQIANLQNDLAQQVPTQPIVIQGDTLGYYRYVEVVKGLKTDLADLKKVVKDQRLELKTSTDMVVKVLARLDSISTVAGPDSTRLFDQSFYESALRLSGRFQIKPPYGLAVDTLAIFLKANLSIARRKDGAWISTVTGLPPFATVDIARTQVDESVYWQTPERQVGIGIGPSYVRYLNHNMVGMIGYVRYRRVMVQGQALTAGWGMGLFYNLR
jgi:hypothetical protein